MILDDFYFLRLDYVADAPHCYFTGNFNIVCTGNMEDTDITSFFGSLPHYHWRMASNVSQNAIQTIPYNSLFVAHQNPPIISIDTEVILSS